jgi:tRNA acetyltransferase TAN1
MVYTYNLLVSIGWSNFYRAQKEIRDILSAMDDDHPVIRRTIAWGIVGVQSQLDSRRIIEKLYELYNKDSSAFSYTVKWVPVDQWTSSDMSSMEQLMASLKESIAKDERWMMVVEKRRYTCHHKADIINRLASHIDGKVDLRKPEKIVRVEIIGQNAGITILRPKEIFSLAMASRSSVQPV